MATPDPSDLLIVSSDREYQIIWTDVVGPRTAKKLRAEIRGASGHLVTNLVRDVFAGHGTVQKQSWQAIPVEHPFTRAVIAVQLHHIERCLVPHDLPVWVWDTTEDCSPPRLHLSPTALDFFGVSQSNRDRSVYGPADFFTRTPHLGEALRHLNFLYDSQPVSYTAFTVQVTDDGAVRMISISQARSDTMNQIIGVGAVDSVSDKSAWSMDVLLTDQLAIAEGYHVALVDIRFPESIYVLRWVGGPPDGIGHGMSTGQSSGIHPDDRPTLAQLVIDAAQQASTHTERLPAAVVRIRRDDGDYQQMHFRPWFIDTSMAPSIIAVVLDPPDQV